METLKILDKVIYETDESYLIHWRGQHQTNAKWAKKSEIVCSHPSVLTVLEQYDRDIDLLCKRLKIQQVSTVTNIRSIKDTLQKQAKKVCRKSRKLRRRISKDQNQRFQKAKQLQNQCNKNVCTSADDFTLSINTPFKTYCHWNYGDHINKIEGKQPNKPLYTVIWKDKSKTVVTEEELMERECEQLCNFLEARLLRRISKKPCGKQKQSESLPVQEINQQL